jgi:hypothetical protein
MKLLIAALPLAATPAEAGITRWDDITCWEGVQTRDNKTFTWIRENGTKTRCKTYARRDDARVLICKDGSTPMMRIIDDGHIVWNRVEMWTPADDNGVCD